MKEKLNCILLIDDDEPTNFIHNIIIQNVGCANEVLVFEDASEALQTLHEREGHRLPNPEVIFLDINMPGMNGWQFLEAYHSLPEHLQEGVIVVLLTTSQNPDDRRKSKEFAKISAFHTKPLTESFLKELLIKHFPERFKM